MIHNKAIEISYIKEKLDKSTIITIEESITIFESQSEFIDIKNSIIAILECTNLHEQLDKNTEGRHIYKLEKDITEHINGIISQKYNKEEKKELIKNILNGLTNNISSILTRGDNIYINNTGVEKKKITINNKEQIEKRYNGYEGDELTPVINEYIGDKKQIQVFIKNILTDINYHKLNNSQIAELLTLGNKSFLFHKISNGIKNHFNLEDTITNGISGKILRDNFSYSNIILYEKIFNSSIIKKINTLEFEELILNNIKENYFNLNKNNIFENIENINQIYDINFNKLLHSTLKKFFGYKGEINNRAIYIIKLKLGLKLNKNFYEKIIKNIIENLIITLKNNLSRLPTTTIELLKQIGTHFNEIQISYLKTPTDIINISSNLKLLLNDESKIEKLINGKKINITKLEKEKKEGYQKTTLLELKYTENKDKIKKQLIKIGFTSLLNMDLTKSSLIKESSSLSKKQKIIISLLDQLTTNSVKKVINNYKIKKIKGEIEKNKKKISSIEIMIKLINENSSIKNKIDKYNSNNKLLHSNIQKINILEEELIIITDKINKIKIGLINLFIKK